MDFAKRHTNQVGKYGDYKYLNLNNVSWCKPQYICLCILVNNLVYINFIFMLLHFFMLFLIANWLLYDSSNSELPYIYKQNLWKMWKLSIINPNMFYIIVTFVRLLDHVFSLSILTFQSRTYMTLLHVLPMRKAHG
jgi:hypothetical protein